MTISEVRIKLVDDGGKNGKLLAFATVAFDHQFVVRDLKIITGDRGIFIAMPSRRITLPCPSCHYKNPIRVKYCNFCAKPLPNDPEPDRTKFYADIAHPICVTFREQVESAVKKAYQEEKEKAKLPGYVCGYDNYERKVNAS